MVARALARLLVPFFRTPAKGAETSIWLASAPEVADASGQYFVDCEPKQSSVASHDETTARRLWDASLQLTGLDGSVAPAFA